MKELRCRIDENNTVRGWANPTALIAQDPAYISVLVDDNYIPHIGYDKIINGDLESHETEWLHDKEMFIHNDAIINNINVLKAHLADTDYLATKHSEGLISEEEYAPIKAERQGWRDQINELEAQLWTE